ncbi:MAG: glycosyltransferase family 10 [Rhodobacteraceae bacterium]|nr:glycosyltransferase family 10 [Paracoccaceae bacterium]
MDGNSDHDASEKVDVGPAVAICPYGKRLGWRPGRIPTSELIWPLGMPARLQGATLAGLAPTDHLILYPRRTHYIRPNFGTRAQISLMIVEPEALHGKHVEKVKRFHRKFFRIFTAVDHLIEEIPNAVLLPYGTTWVPGWRDIDTTKHRMTSLIASEKDFLLGHRLRHQIAAFIAKEHLDVDVIGKGYRPFAGKWEGLAPHRFSIVIENAVQPNYFTEKLIDAILCDTVPIYLGCPNIDRYINPDGMLLCQSREDLQAAVRSVSIDLYEEKIGHLRKSRHQALYYADFHERSARTLISEAWTG